MKFTSWLKHLGLLTGIYVLFAVVSLWGVGLGLRDEAMRLGATAHHEVIVWLAEDTDAGIARKFAVTRELRAKGPTLMGDLWWVDESGRTVATTSEFPLPPYWREKRIPTKRLESVFYNGGTKQGYAVSLVHDNPVRYLVSAELYMHGPNPQTKTVWNRVVGIAGLFLIWFLVGAAFLATVTVLYIFRMKSRQAGRVMNAIENGDLKARFPLTRADEVSGLMNRFNRMADTIESLVARVRASERKRVELLQELSHDLRTPLTSLSVLVQTLEEFHTKFSNAKRAKAIRDMGKELDYVVRLVQFLFTISDSDEATYRVDFRVENLSELIESEIKHRRAVAFPGGKALKWTFEAEEAPHHVQADTALLGRVFRNALDNASKFAAGAVHVSLEDAGETWVLSILDDGPGPSAAALAGFGKRPKNPAALRVLEPGQSTGLGSAILTAVAQLHGGKAILKRGPHGGGLLELHLPKYRAEKTRRAA